MKGKRETRLKIKSRWDQQFFIAHAERERARRTKASADDTKRNEREDILSLGISED